MGCVSVKKRNEPIVQQSIKSAPVNVYISDEKDL